MHPRMIKKKIFYEKYALQTRLLIKQNAPHAGFGTKSSWVLCPIEIECNFFSANHSSESSSFD